MTPGSAGRASRQGPGVLWRYRRERLPFLIFAPVTAALAGAALWSAGTAEPGAVLRTCVLMVLLVSQFRVWDDLADADADRITHPERLLPRVPPGPFRLATFVLGGTALAVASVERTSWIALLLLDVSFLAAYRTRSVPPGRTWRYGVLLLKYPAFVVIASLAAGGELMDIRLLAATAAAYLAAVSYEYWHADRRVRVGTAAALSTGH